MDGDNESHFGGGYGERHGGHGGFEGGGGFRRFAPVRVGEEYDVKIESVGSKGDGVAKIKGFVLFVPGTTEGQEVRVKVTRVLRKVGFAEVVGAAGSKSEAAQEAPAEEAAEGLESSEEATEESGVEFTEEQPAEAEEFGESKE